uniref:RecQl3 n=1 Tax=Arundo donax TaxID=35708 RepID=A0A0A9EA25_ARUDO
MPLTAPALVPVIVDIAYLPANSGYCWGLESVRDSVIIIHSEQGSRYAKHPVLNASDGLRTPSSFLEHDVGQGGVLGVPRTAGTQTQHRARALSPPGCSRSNLRGDPGPPPCWDPRAVTRSEIMAPS